MCSIESCRPCPSKSRQTCSTKPTDTSKHNVIARGEVFQKLCTLSTKRWSSILKTSSAAAELHNWWQSKHHRCQLSSSRIWMEQLTCSLPCCHCEARNQWLVAWDRSNWHFQYGEQHRLSTPEVGSSEMNNGVETCSLIQIRLLDTFRLRQSSVEVKTSMQSHCKVLRSMQLATVIKSWVTYRKNARGRFWWRLTLKPQIALASHVFVKIR